MGQKRLNKTFIIEDHQAHKGVNHVKKKIKETMDKTIVNELRDWKNKMLLPYFQNEKHKC